MSVADAAVIVVNGKAGIEVGTIKAWEICERRQIPRIFLLPTWMILMLNIWKSWSS